MTYIKQYLYVEQLAKEGPWSEQAIRTKMARGEFKEGVHYFKKAYGSRPIFKWDAVVAFIEEHGKAAENGAGIPLANGTVIDEAA